MGLETTLIIGKRSNLSQHLAKNIENSILISSQELIKNIEVLSEYKNYKINIIFNNFKQSTQLNKLENCFEYVSSSIISTSKVLDFFDGCQLEKVIYSSSSSVYGNNILCAEGDIIKPLNLHASLKVANEKLLEKFCSERNINFTIARVFNMYGGNDNFSIISKIIKAYKEDKEITIVNNGNAIRDFIHIDDVVESYIALLNSKELPIVNIGTGNGNSIKNILDFLNNNGIVIKTNNIFREELKVSTAENRILCNLLKNKEFTKIQTYLKKELQI